MLGPMDRDEICARFLEVVEFDLYPYQEEALLAWFEEKDGVLVCAPTGMGKTLIAEAAVFEALHTRRQLYYTTPLIALTDQKYRDLQDQVERWGFSRDDVGLITGNRRENPGALVRVVVAEILLNHLLSPEAEMADLSEVGAVVMDEFHNFNDRDRGIVWELSLVLLPAHVRVLLLSATVGNPLEFGRWLRKEHGRNLRVILSDERRVPLEFNWVGEKLLTEQLPAMASGDDGEMRTPALVFCFVRDACWELAERLKGLPLIPEATRVEIRAYLDGVKEDFIEGVGPKLKQILIRGVGVHHAGVLPKHKEVVETLFLRKLVPLVVCTETLAAGINLPARSVVLSTLIKGKRGEKKLIPASSAHQMFGRAGRPQFDTQGYVYAMIHEDDVKIFKWRKKYDQLDPNSKDPGILRARKSLERKRPTRRKTEQYWSEGQFRQLIDAGPANLLSRSMIGYSVLLFLLTKTNSVEAVRLFLSKRFNTAEHIAQFEQQLEYMLANLSELGYVTRLEGGDAVTLLPSFDRLLAFRSVDPLYGAFLTERLVRSDFNEKVLALESVLSMPPAIARKARIPDMPAGTLQTEELEPLMISMGVVLTRPDPKERDDEWLPDPDEEIKEPPTFPEMLKIAFEARLAAPESIDVQPKWVAGGVFEANCDFFPYVRARNLVKQEGIILRHLLRLVLLAGEFHALTQDPEYQRIAELATRACHHVDPRYTDRFLEQSEETRNLTPEHAPGTTPKP